jgi:trk system potassium uptake protein TrkA
VLARIYDPRRAELYRELDIRTISSVEWATAQLLAMIANPRLHSEYQFGEGDVQLIEVEAPVKMVDMRLPEFEVPGEIKVTVIVRDHLAIIPVPGMRVERGDRLYVAVARDSVDAFERIVGKGAV